MTSTDKAMDALNAAQAALWSQFGVDHVYSDIEDCRGKTWALGDGVVQWLEQGILYEYPLYDKPTFTNDTHTVVVMSDMAGGSIARLFSNEERQHE